MIGASKLLTGIIHFLCMIQSRQSHVHSYLKSGVSYHLNSLKLSNHCLTLLIRFMRLKSAVCNFELVWEHKTDKDKIEFMSYHT